MARSRSRHSHPAIATALTTATFLLAACGALPGEAGTRSTFSDPPPTASSEDTPPDPPTEEAPVSDADLSLDQMVELVTVPASSAAAPNQCTPPELSFSLAGFDAAAGHRYSGLVASNIGTSECALVGWPGLGFRGDQGSAFPLVAEQSNTDPGRVNQVPNSPRQPVSIAPGDAAIAYLEWTGALAGAEEEKASLIGVQLSADGPVMPLAVDPSDPVDIGADTTVRLWAWRPMPQ